MSTLNVSTINVSNVVFPNGSTFTQVPPTPTLNSLISGTPSSGQRLEYNGNAWVPVTGGAGGRLLQVNAYTRDGGGHGESIANMRDGQSWTWSRPSGCTKVLIYCTGAGAGSSTNDQSYRGWGGGAGGTAIGFYDVTNLGQFGVTTGSGSQGRRDQGRAGQGGTSTAHSFCSATGGYGGGESPYQGGNGGVASGGFINLTGGGGQGDHDANHEGNAGSSIWYQAGGNHHNGNGQGDNDFYRHNVKGRFGGGGGTSYGSSHSNNDWRAGGGGVVIVYSYS